MAKKRTAKKTAKTRTRAATKRPKSTTVTTMTTTKTKTTRTTRSANPQYEEKLQTGGSTVTVRGVGDVVIDSDGRVARVPGSIPGRGEIIATRFGNRWKPSTGKMRSMTAPQRKSVVAVLDGMDWVGNPSATYWSIDTGDGNQLTTGLQPEIVARRVAQRLADERGESVFLYASDLGEDEAAEEIEPSREENPLRLGKQDKAVIRAFTERQAAEGDKLTTNGTSLDGYWSGGNHIAYWQSGKIHLPEIGSRAAQTVQNAVKREAPKNDLFNGRGYNPGGQHVACGDLSDKDCRQVQHVYESARSRGASKTSAAKQARGSLRNPKAANPFSQVASKDPKAARLLAIAFIVAHNGDEVHPVLRAFDRERGARGGALGAWLQGKYFLPYGDEVYGWDGQNFQDLQDLAHAFYDRSHNPHGGRREHNPSVAYFSEITLREGVILDESNEDLLLLAQLAVAETDELERNPSRQKNLIKGGKYPTFAKVDDKIWISHANFASEDAYGRKYDAKVDFRIDGRDGPFYRVDMHTLGPWEAIDGGEQSAREQIRTLPAAKALVAKWIAAAKEQQTISPRVARASNPAPARQKNPRQASMSRRISGA